MKGSLGLLGSVYVGKLRRTEPRTELNLQAVLPICPCSSSCLGKAEARHRSGMTATVLIPAPWGTDTDSAKP